MIRKLEFDVVSSRLTVWWDEDDEPFSPSEYETGSRTKAILDKLEVTIRVAAIEAAWNLA